MNRTHDSFVLLSCIVLQNLADPHRRKAIKPWCGFVKQNALRVSNQFYANGSPLALSSWDRLFEYRAHLGILTFAQTKVSDKFGNSLVLLLLTACKLESRRKSEGLFDSEVGEYDVVLHDIARIFAE